MNPLRKKLDDMLSQHVRLRDAILTTETKIYARCITCNQVFPIKEMDAGHFIRRGKDFIRFHPLNVHAQCVPCNRFKKGLPEQFKAALKVRYCNDLVRLLESMQNKIVQFRDPDYQNLIENFEDWTDSIERVFPPNELEFWVGQEGQRKIKQFDLNEFIQ